MFIQTQETPNPATMKFLPGRDVMGENGTAFYTDEEAAKASPLAEGLFTIGNVTAVFLGKDFITVTKTADAEWETLKPSLLTYVMDHFVTGKPVLAEACGDVEKATPVDSDDPIVKQIIELIDTRVRPAVAMDGGDIIFHSFDENGIVRLEMHGACSGCPSSTATLKQGIENMLKHYVPEVQSVEPV